MNDITQLLAQIKSGDQHAAGTLLPIVYQELRDLAAAKMDKERPDHTLQPTALVHEAYLRLVDSRDQQAWDSREHFFSAAAEAMRRILVEHARAKGRLKRGGDWQRVDVREDDVVETTDPTFVIAVHEALDSLEAEDPRLAKLVKLRYFVGLTFREAADVLNIAPSTAAEDWAYAKARLKVMLNP